MDADRRRVGHRAGPHRGRRRRQPRRRPRDDRAAGAGVVRPRDRAAHDDASSGRGARARRPRMVRDPPRDARGSGRRAQPVVLAARSPLHRQRGRRTDRRRRVDRSPARRGRAVRARGAAAGADHGPVLRMAPAQRPRLRLDSPVDAHRQRHAWRPRSHRPSRSGAAHRHPRARRVASARRRRPRPVGHPARHDRRVRRALPRGSRAVERVVGARPYAVSRPGDSPFQQPQRTGSGGASSRRAS